MIINQSLLERFTSTWAPADIPHKTVLSYVDPTNTVGLQATLSAISASAMAAENLKDLYYLQKEYRAAEASLTIALAQEYLQTATATQYFPQATQVIFNATLNLINLENDDNLYGTRLQFAPNLLFAIIFGVLFLYNCIIPIKSRQLYFAVCLICGTGLELAGYVGRTLAVYDLLNLDRFLCQIICLTISPAFIMAGVYYLLAELIVIYGRQYSLLKPLWFSYAFIFCDVISLVIQAAGGGMAGFSLQNYKSTAPGTHVMVAGIIFQVVTMSFFIVMLFHFMYRIFFTSHPDVKPGVFNFFRLLFNTPTGRYFKSIQDSSFSENYADIRARKLFIWMPLMVLISVIVVYIRCIYRAIELNQGWVGFLITHETYVFCFDGAMILICCLIYVPFHPRIVFGRQVDLTVKAIKQTENEMAYDNDKVDEQEILDNSSVFDFEKPQQQKREPRKLPKEKYRVSKIRPPQTRNRPMPTPYDRPTSFSQSESARDSWGGRGHGRSSTLTRDSDIEQYDYKNSFKPEIFTPPEFSRENDSTVRSSLSDFSIRSARPHPYRSDANYRSSDSYGRNDGYDRRS